MISTIFAALLLQCAPADRLVPDSWHLDAVRAPSAWCNFDGAGIKVAVVDTGIDPHEDLVIAPGRNIWLGQDTPTDDPQWHGTVTAGIIGMQHGNALGGAGIAPGCTLIPVRCSNTFQPLSMGVVADGIIWATDNGARVIMAFAPGDLANGLVIRAAIDHAEQNRVIVVVASGNNGIQLSNFNGPEIMVGGTTREGDVWPLSNYGQPVDILAPCVDIWSTEPGGGYGVRTQTSSAAPIVAGVCALILDKNPNLGPQAVRNILIGSARDGIVDARAAVDATPPMPGERPSK